MQTLGYTISIGKLKHFAGANSTMVLFISYIACAKPASSSLRDLYTCGSHSSFKCPLYHFIKL